ncbi:hypothetical protein LV89_04384 [Arcicella aurantiaca]|uniref:DUF7452 domain-containing protein n=1 Tax=Arcicella aurantiaca TaxID=591202 RepID=A0A316DJP1_9BACT|nr:hypothetical protein [Arcicella aurantiaca]PWK17469.1 hypothetical protein LV89_04384 [Arcicella aurantiaca]
MKKIYYISTILLCVFLQTANAQMGVNSTGALPASSAMLDVSSTNKGFLPPRMTTSQRNAIASPTDGLVVFDTDLGELYVRRFGVWSPTNIPRTGFGISNVSTAPTIGVYNTGTGVGINGVGTTGSGVVGTSTSGFGVYGVSTNLYGVSGFSANNVGVYGESTSSYGLMGVSTSQSGVYGQNNSSTNATAKFVNASASGTSGRFEGSGGIGVLGIMSSSGTGVYGESNTGDGGYFKSTSGKGLTATSSSNSAIYADNTSATAPVAQFANLSGGTALSVVAQTALDIAGGIRVSGVASTKAAFKITTSASNTAGNVLTIPNTTLANNATDILLVTHAFGTYLNKPFGVYWTGASWGIYVEDLTAMPIGTVFNVLVIKQ